MYKNRGREREERERERERGGREREGGGIRKGQIDKSYISQDYLLYCGYNETWI